MKKNFIEFVNIGFILLGKAMQSRKDQMGLISEICLLHPHL